MSISAEQLRLGFEYDLWANIRWLNALSKFPNPERPQEILGHILFAHEIWLNRCFLEKAVLSHDLTPRSFSDAIALWIAALDTADTFQEIAYTTRLGEPFVNTFGEICQHVINHGSYHRGQLRGLAEMFRIESFPETDYILFLRERQASGTLSFPS